MASSGKESKVRRKTKQTVTGKKGQCRDFAGRLASLRKRAVNERAYDLPPPMAPPLRPISFGKFFKTFSELFTLNILSLIPFSAFEIPSLFNQM